MLVPEQSFEAELPRREVRADLLQTFEIGLLPSKGDHGNKKAKPGWVKGFKQVIVLPMHFKASGVAKRCLCMNSTWGQRLIHLPIAISRAQLGAQFLL